MAEQERPDMREAMKALHDQQEHQVLLTIDGCVAIKTCARITQVQSDESGTYGVDIWNFKTSTGLDVTLRRERKKDQLDLYTQPKSEEGQ